LKTEIYKRNRKVNTVIATVKLDITCNISTGMKQRSETNIPCSCMKVSNH